MTSTRIVDPLVVLLLDSGQGDATVILLPGGRAVIFDCRNDQVVDRHLRDFGVEHIEAVIISHLDWDHIAGAEQLLVDWRQRVSCVYIDTDERVLADDTPENQAAKSLIDFVTLPGPGESRVPWSVRTPQSDVVIAEGEDWQVCLLAPAHRLRLRDERSGRTPNVNERSAVLQLSHVGNDGSCNRVLVGADAPLVAWAEISVEELQATVFRTPHHGGPLDDGGIPHNWSAGVLYDAVGPSNAVISVGTNN